MPDTLQTQHAERMEAGLGSPAVAAPILPALSAPPATRRPALPGFIVRKLFAANVQGELQTLLAACQAELDWAVADWRRVNRGRWEHERDVDRMAAADRLPVEKAAAVVLNIRGHMIHPEARLRVLWPRYRIRRTDGTRDDLRYYLAERRKLKPMFAKAVAEYRRLRTGLPLGGKRVL